MKGLQNRVVKRVFWTFLGVFLAVKPVSDKVFDPNVIYGEKTIASSNMSEWKSINAPEGGCKCSFPKNPERLQQKAVMKDSDQEIKYSVYVADHERKSVYMLLIAEYPGVVSNENAPKNLEYFLNSLLAQSSKNKLIFADLIKVNGYTGMDFFIATNNVYFKGRLVQKDNILILAAMECEIPNYQEDHYTYFIESFEISRGK